MSPYFLSVSNDISTVALAVFIAILGPFCALDLGCQIWNSDDRLAKRLWMVATSIALGTAMWSTHVVGMAAADYPVPTSYDVLKIAASWLISVAVAAIPVSLAPHRAISWSRLGLTSCGTAAGLIAVHYVGIFALQSGPSSRILPGHLAGMAAMSLAGSFAGLKLFIGFRETEGWRRLRWQAAAAGVTGVCLASVHFLAMGSVEFWVDPNPVASRGLDVETFGDVVAATSIVFLSITIMMTALERKAMQRVRALHGSLFRAEEELRMVSLSDPTTGLPNRLVFQDRLNQAIARSKRQPAAVAVLLIDIDAFRDYANAWTPDMESDVLRAMAERLKLLCRASDTLTTAGNGQFLILLDGDDAMGGAARTAQAVLDAVRRPCLVPSGMHVLLTASIGISLMVDGLASTALVVNASAAMLVAAQQGGNRFRFFEERMNAEAQAAAEILDDLRHAVARSELQLHYQPKVLASSGQAAGVEALVRWNRKGKGLVSPAVFIPLAERFGLINDIGAWVFDEACRQIRAWSDVGLHVRTAVNVSPCQLRQTDLIDQLLGRIEHHGIDHRLLTLEITETAAMEDTNHSLRTFDVLNTHGLNISVDDFGTGYSSLSYLRRLPVRQIKIDRSFVCDLETSADARAVAEAIVKMAHSLRLEVVAEGVETREQQVILMEMGCDKLQGLLFSRPVVPNAITRLFSGTPKMLPEQHQHVEAMALS